jgi:subtilisin-like proprotein convertase family protein
VTKVTATVKNINHTIGSEIDVLLVGPGGQRLLLMSDAGGPLLGNTYTFDDNAALCLTRFGTLVSGTYQPTNEFQNDVFPPPAPPGPYNDPQSLSVFNGTNPNGTWSLYTFDDAPGDGGTIDLGWELSITTNSCSAVTVSGRVLTPAGAALRNAVVSLIDQSGVRRIATTSSFGVYSFANVSSGQTYTITVASKRYRFGPRILQINENVANLDFLGLE